MNLNVNVHAGNVSSKTLGTIPSGHSDLTLPKIYVIHTVNIKVLDCSECTHVQSSIRTISRPLTK